MAVIARKDETVDTLLKRFKKECAKSGIIADFRKHESYTPPSQKRREKWQRNARLRMKKSK